MMLSMLKFCGLNKRIRLNLFAKCRQGIQCQTLGNNNVQALKFHKSSILSNYYVSKRIIEEPPTNTAISLAKPIKKRAVNKNDAESDKEEDVSDNTVKVKPVTKRAVNKKEAEKDKEDVSDKKLKAKPVTKKVVNKNDAESDEEEDVSDKNLKTKAVKRRAARKDDAEAPEEVSDKKLKKNPVKKETKSEAQSKSDKDVAPKKKKTTAKAGPSKGEKAVDKKENGAVEKVTKSKKAASASKAKKTTVTRPKRGAKPDSEEDEADEEKPVESTTGRKRKAAAKPEAPKDEPESKTSKFMNATSTNWEEIDFKCSSKNLKGNDSTFHITSWNVDGLRAWLKKGGLDILQHDNPDIFCIQETKCSLEKLPDEVKDIEGYETLWCSSEKEGYAGVGIATKIKPLSVTYGIEDEDQDSEGRCITAEYEKFFLVNVYVPNAGRKLVTLPKRLEWNELFKTHIKNLNERKPVIICGDMNVAHLEIDLANPKTNTKNAGFTPEEREGMTDFLEDGYIDTFRKLYPDKEKAYTFWTYMGGARTKNVGWRLDYFIVSEGLMEDVCDNIIHKDVLGSDHCPLTLHLNI